MSSVSPPESLLVVTNRFSKALLPSDISSPEFKSWAHSHGAYIYMVLVGPRVTIAQLKHSKSYWTIKVQAAEDPTQSFVVPVPFDVLPSSGPTLSGGIVRWVDSDGEERRANAVELARSALASGSSSDDKHNHWKARAVTRVFNYRVSYIGKAYGKAGARTAHERLVEGHAQLQDELAQTADYFPDSAVAVMAMGVDISRREAMFTLTRDNVDEIGKFAANAMTDPDGPLSDEPKLVMAVEAMLIRAFPNERNEEYKEFPTKDAPTLVRELVSAGVTHLGVQLDVSRSFAVIQDPEGIEPPSNHLRFSVNLATGNRETPRTTSPLTWLDRP